VGLLTIGLIVVAAWASIVVIVLAMCKAAASADARSEARRPTRGDARRFDRVAVH
jgi:hypothetical protein